MKYDTSDVVSNIEPNSHFTRNEHLMVYPNPANEYLMINFPKSRITNPVVNVYSIDGKKVLSENSNVISVQTLGNGIYFVETIVFNTSFKSKIVISK